MQKTFPVQDFTSMANKCTPVLIFRKFYIYFIDYYRFPCEKKKT